MPRILCDSLLDQFKSTWVMLEMAFQGITDEHWMIELNGWTYAEVVYHIIITQEYYIRDTPEGMKWDLLYGDLENQEYNPRQYYPSKQTLQNYHNEVKGKVEAYLLSMTDEDLHESDGFKRYLGPIHKKLVYLLRHNAHHLGELALMHRTYGLERIKWT